MFLLYIMSVLDYISFNNISSNNISLLEDNEIPIYNFKDKYYKLDYNLINIFLKKYGIIIFKNYYNKNDIELMKNEIKKLEKELLNNKTKNTEMSSGDFRLFHVEKKCEILKKLISDNNTRVFGFIFFVS